MQNPSLVAFVTHENETGSNTATVSVDGIHCAGCINAIERRLATEPDIAIARVHFGTHQMRLQWSGVPARIDAIADIVRGLGYGVRPSEINLSADESEEVKPILRALVWAGFGTGNIMLFAAPVWFADHAAMGDSTRDLMHWLMGLVALIIVPIAGQPFFKSAWAAVKNGHGNMDVPISVGVILATLSSLYGTFTHADHVYFDAGVMLLFFLLIGRYLDVKSRARAKGAATNVLSLLSATSNVIEPDGTYATLPVNQLKAGMVLAVSAGERIMADGEVIEGTAQLDKSLLTGETAPETVTVGDIVPSGAIPLDAPLRVRVSVPHEQTLLAQIVKTMQNAEQDKSRYVRLADRIARFYTPVVHSLAALCFILWWHKGIPTPEAVMYAVSVLIITCPCALGLAVPVVQVIAASRLMKRQVLIKTADALERLSQVDTVLLDKTGTLTLGHPEPVNLDALPLAMQPIAQALAAASSHPLARALATHLSMAGSIPAHVQDITETAGIGMRGVYQGIAVQLGRANMVGAAPTQPSDHLLEIWFQYGTETPVRLTFADTLRPDASDAVAAMRALGLDVQILSGDRPAVVAAMAKAAGIEKAVGGLTPLEKSNAVAALKNQGHRVLMVGDGLNDAPGLASAFAAMAPQTGMDITQNAADAIFLGNRLMPVAESIHTARIAQRLVKQNIWMALLYNVFAVPLAFFGMVTPMVAAVAMSSSSVIVVGNALRLNRLKDAQS